MALVHPVVYCFPGIRIVICHHQRDHLYPAVEWLGTVRFVGLHPCRNARRADGIGHVVPHQAVARHPVEVVAEPDGPIVTAAHGERIGRVHDLGTERRVTRSAVELHGRVQGVIRLHVPYVGVYIEPRPGDIPGIARQGEIILDRVRVRVLEPRVRVEPEAAGDYPSRPVRGDQGVSAQVRICRHRWRKCAHHRQYEHACQHALYVRLHCSLPGCLWFRECPASRQAVDDPSMAKIFLFNT